MNPFQNPYLARLQEWRDLRERVVTLPISSVCVEIDRWWQQAPLINHHLHWQDQANWSDPWTMLSENLYCPLTRAVGMCYTILMTTTVHMELVHARDRQSEDHYLVLVDDAKYIMNWWPNSVLSTRLDEFNIISSKNLESIKTKIK
jgi:hypothetical protein